jgi:hypothetical protein
MIRPTRFISPGTRGMNNKKDQPKLAFAKHPAMQFSGTSQLRQSGRREPQGENIMFDFTSLLVGGIPLTIVIFGLVEFIKSLGLRGKALTVCSLLLGLLLGIAYQFSVSGVPATYAGWFSSVISGLALGLVASGFYKFASARFPEVP